LVLSIPKINTVKNIYVFVKYPISVLGTLQKRPQILGTRYSAKFGTRFSPNRWWGSVDHLLTIIRQVTGTVTLTCEVRARKSVNSKRFR